MGIGNNSTRSTRVGQVRSSPERDLQFTLNQKYQLWYHRTRIQEKEKVIFWVLHFWLRFRSYVRVPPPFRQLSRA